MGMGCRHNNRCNSCDFVRSYPMYSLHLIHAWCESVLSLKYKDDGTISRRNGGQKFDSRDRVFTDGIYI